MAKKAKHITTTSKKPHAWEFVHDDIGFNYRLPNINAALGCAQLEQLPQVKGEKESFSKYQEAFSNVPDASLFVEPPNCSSNYWLQTLKLNTDRIVERDAILKATNQAGLMTRPAWRLMHQLKPYANCPKMNLSNSEKMVKSLLNIPSSPELDKVNQ